MKKFWLVVLVVIANVISAVSAEDNIKIRQTMGDGQIFFWYHNSNLWTSEFLFSTPSDPWIMVGVGPRFIATVRRVKISVLNYFALMQDVSKKHWPVKAFEVENLTTAKVDKWIVHLRTVVDIPQETHIVFIGREFLGYQVAKNLELRFQTEWKRQKSIVQSCGLGWNYSLTPEINFDGYFGIGIKDPFAKVRWFRLSTTFK